jgi:hypothetical protein
MFSQLPPALQDDSIRRIQVIERDDELLDLRLIYGLPAPRKENTQTMQLCCTYSPRVCNVQLAAMYEADSTGCFPIRRDIEASTSSDANWRLARQWLSTCKRDHDYAKVGKQSLPTRLIHIRSDVDTMKLRLHIPGALAADQEYCTLSHCWGKSQVVKLERHNISEFQREIPFGKLSKIFQHAVLAAWKVGFEYIWIDVLCIVQDNHEDWQREAATWPRSMPNPA